MKDLCKGHDKTRTKLEIGNLSRKSQLPLWNLWYCSSPGEAVSFRNKHTFHNWSDSGDHGSLVHVNRPHIDYFNATQYKRERERHAQYFRLYLYIINFDQNQINVISFAEISRSIETVGFSVPLTFC